MPSSLKSSKIVLPEIDKLADLERRLASEEGEGTTVNLYLPRSNIDEDAVHSTAQDDVPVAGGETILVVEDDPDVRTLTVTLLSDLGYGIPEAADAKSALAALDSSSSINLLFSDMVLPGGISGPEPAAEILQRRPGIAILHTSGYTENAALHQGRLDNGIELINKPFKKSDLTQMVRAASINRNCERSPPMV